MSIIEKPASTQYPILPALVRRWSPRAYNPDRPVPQDVLQSAFEAARWAMSSFNEQPWRFIVGVKGQGDNWEKVLSCYNDWNQQWARLAPVLILVVGRTTYTLNNKPNPTWQYECGIATGLLVTQATSAPEIQCHTLGGILPDKAHEVFGIPAEYTPVSGITIGYQADGFGQLPESYHQDELKTRTRHTLAEQVFSGAWGSPTSL